MFVLVVCVLTRVSVVRSSVSVMLPPRLVQRVVDGS